MKDKVEIKSRFKPSLLIGVLAGYIVVFILSQIIQYLIGLLLGVDGIHLVFEYYKFTCEFVFSPGSGKFVSKLHWRLGAKRSRIIEWRIHRGPVWSMQSSSGIRVSRVVGPGMNESVDKRRQSPPETFPDAEEK